MPALAAALALPGTALADTPASEAVSLLSAQRADNGIPAGLTERAPWSAACAAHDRYERANGGALSNGELKGDPGYTTAGAFAGRNSVLAAGRTWRDGNPWETAPIHLMQLLAPRLQRLGVDDRKGYVCATTWPGYADSGPSTPVIYSYPGDGQAGWRASEVAREGPFTPGYKVGLPQTARTGPYLYALLDGPGSWFALRSAPLTSASLIGPEGALEIRSVAADDPDIGRYLPPGAMLIPVKPLQAGSLYTAHVTFRVGGAPVSRTWSFRTGGAADVGPEGLSVASTWPRTVVGRVASGRVSCTRACRFTAGLFLRGRKRSVASRKARLQAGGTLRLRLRLPRSFAGSTRRARIIVRAKDVATGRAATPLRNMVTFTS